MLWRSASKHIASNLAMYDVELSFGSCGMSVSTVDEAIVFETKLRNNVKIYKTLKFA